MTILKAENISKQYRLGVIGTGTLSHDLNRLWYKVRGKEDPYLKIGEVNDRSSKTKSEYVWALNDINFEVKQGEVLGIIGKNGAGKSTLLKILSRVTLPTTGVIKTRGRIASLLEVGTGFHPELTGRENVFLNGAILGMTKTEIAAKLDEIVEFSGCEMYIDTPVKRYSSGMKVRLAFAVAAHLEPDILVIDEVLAVGDAEFQKKAIGKMQDISKEGGRTVLFVSHNMASVKSLCTRGIVLENGTTVFDGDIDECVDYYIGNRNKESRDLLYKRDDREGNGGLIFEKVIIKNNGKPDRDLQSGCKADFEIYFKIKNPCEGVVFRLAVLDNNETTLFICNNKIASKPIDVIYKDGKVILTIPDLPLSEGYYYYNLSAKSKDRGLLDSIEFAGGFTVVADDFFKSGFLPKAKTAFLVKNYWNY